MFERNIPKAYLNVRPASCRGSACGIVHRGAEMKNDRVRYVTCPSEGRPVFAAKTRKDVDVTAGGLSASLMALFENDLASQAESQP